MTNTLSTRLNLTVYGDRTVDGPTMVIENANVAVLEALTTIGGLGPTLSIPAAGKGPRVYLATDTNVLYFDNGTSWVVVGTFVLGTQTVKANAGQSAALQVYQDSTGTLLAQVDVAGKFIGHFSDTNVWTSPAAGLQTGWTNAAGFYYGMQYLRSGDFCQFRGEVIAGGGATALLTIMDAAAIPRDTQRFPVWNSNANSYGNWTARLIGNKDAGGGTPGALYIDNFVIGQTYSLNLPYLVHA